MLICSLAHSLPSSWERGLCLLNEMRRFHSISTHRHSAVVVCNHDFQTAFPARCSSGSEERSVGERKVVARVLRRERDSHGRHLLHRLSNESLSRMLRGNAQHQDTGQVSFALTSFCIDGGTGSCTRNQSSESTTDGSTHRQTEGRIN